MNYNELFEKLASNASRKFKTDVLEAHKNDELLRRVVFLALDPFTNFYIKKIPAYSNGDLNLPLCNALDMLADLCSRTYTGNAGINHLRNILSNVSPDDALVIERIIEKDLRCGVSIATANSVWSSLISEYPCMLCSPYEEKLVSKIKFPAIVQKKEDGMRFNAIVHKDGEVNFRSRNGKPISLNGHLEKDFRDMAQGKALVFDGELLVMKDGKVLDRQTGNGILNKANKGTISDEEASLVVASVWDMIPYEDFVKGVFKVKYIDRLEKLKALVSTGGDKVSVIATHEVKSADEANAIYQRYNAEGFEGIILKDSSSIWEDKRSKQQIKFKAELDCDLEIIGIVEGTGKYKGMLGAIQCKSSDGVVNVEVGSGFSDAQRDELMKDKKLVGKIAAVKYNARIKNKKGEESLFLPVLLEIREDKKVADSSKEIK